MLLQIKLFSKCKYSSTIFANKTLKFDEVRFDFQSQRLFSQYLTKDKRFNLLPGIAS